MLKPLDRYQPAITNAFCVYHIDSETPLAIVKNAINPDDIAFRKLGHPLNPHKDHTQHAMLPINVEHYNSMNNETLYGTHIPREIKKHKVDPKGYRPPEKG